MTYPSEGETIVCQYCGKEIVATQDMDYCYCLSKVKSEEESSWIYLCNWNCLKAYVNESEDSRLKRMNQRQKEREWNIEELLVRNNLWDKFQRHKNMQTCPLCGKEFVDGDSAVFFNGKPIHSECIEKLIDT